MGIKTNNSYLKEKLAIRFLNLPQKKLKVLDAFAGEQIIWRWIIKYHKYNIDYFPIDNIDYEIFGIKGDNIEYLLSLDLNKFDVIDLDCYGIPFKQLEIIFQKKYSGIIFITFIQSIYGGLPHGMLKEIGYKSEMFEKIPAIFNKKGFNKFKEYLAKNGIKEIEYVNPSRNKHYCKINC